jgi:hypothetical protein
LDLGGLDWPEPASAERLCGAAPRSLGLSLVPASRYNGSMKLRHALTLIGLGWYLMAPPVKLGTVAADSPLSGWTVLKDYDDFMACTFGQATLAAQTHGVAAPNTAAILLIPSQAQQFLAAQCVATDDPRLKEN